MINRNAFRVLGLALAFLNILAVARADTDRAPELTFCQSVRVVGCVLPTLPYGLVVRDLDHKLVHKFRSGLRPLHATIGTMDANRLKPLPMIVRPRAAISFYRRRTTGDKFVYFGEEAKELEREKPLSLYPYQTIVATSYVARRALLHIRQAF
jgi:hypothetical protein